MTDNSALMAATEYTSTRCLQTLVRNLGGLERLAERGDRVAMTILIDIKTVMGMYNEAECPMTERQRKVVVWHLRDGYTQTEIASKLGISQRAVSHHLFGGLAAMSRRLEGRG